jgi:hypothetical protein
MTTRVIPELRASTEREGYNYRGVLRHGQTIVWRCPCEYPHQARDCDGRYLGKAAASCARDELGRRISAGEALAGRPTTKRGRISRSIVWEQDPDLPF